MSRKIEYLIKHHGKKVVESFLLCFSGIYNYIKNE